MHQQGLVAAFLIFLTFDPVFSAHSPPTATFENIPDSLRNFLLTLSHTAPEAAESSEATVQGNSLDPDGRDRPEVEQIELGLVIFLTIVAFAWFAFVLGKVRKANKRASVSDVPRKEDIVWNGASVFAEITLIIGTVLYQLALQKLGLETVSAYLASIIVFSLNSVLLDLAFRQKQQRGLKTAYGAISYAQNILMLTTITSLLAALLYATINAIDLFAGGKLNNLEGYQGLLARIAASALPSLIMLFPKRALKEEVTIKHKPGTGSSLNGFRKLSFFSFVLWIIYIISFREFIRSTAPKSVIDWLPLIAAKVLVGLLSLTPIAIPLGRTIVSAVRNRTAAASSGKIEESRGPD